MADRADDDGRSIYQSVGTFSRKTRGSRRTVQRSIMALLDAGLIVVEEAGGGHRTTRYQIALHRLKADEGGCQFDTPTSSGAEEGGVRMSPQGRSDDTPGASECRPRGVRMSPDSSLRHPKDSGARDAGDGEPSPRAPELDLETPATPDRALRSNPEPGRRWRLVDRVVLLGLHGERKRDKLTAREAAAILVKHDERYAMWVRPGGHEVDPTAGGIIPAAE